MILKKNSHNHWYCKYDTPENKKLLTWAAEQGYILAEMKILIKCTDYKIIKRLLDRYGLEPGIKIPKDRAKLRINNYTFQNDKEKYLHEFLNKPENIFIFGRWYKTVTSEFLEYIR